MTCRLKIFFSCVSLCILACILHLWTQWEIFFSIFLFSWNFLLLFDYFESCLLYNHNTIKHELKISCSRYCWLFVLALGASFFFFFFWWMVSIKKMISRIIIFKFLFDVCFWYVNNFKLGWLVVEHVSYLHFSWLLHGNSCSFLDFSRYRRPLLMSSNIFFLKPWPHFVLLSIFSFNIPFKPKVCYFQKWSQSFEVF